MQLTQQDLFRITEILKDLKTESIDIGMTPTSGGAAFVPFNSVACKCIFVVNDTGTDLRVRKTGRTNEVTIFSGSGLTLDCIKDANEYEVRRKDNGAAVNVEYVIEA